MSSRIHTKSAFALGLLIAWSGGIGASELDEPPRRNSATGPVLTDTQKARLNADEASRNFAQKQLLKRLAEFEGQFEQWRSLTDEDRAYYRDFAKSSSAGQVQAGKALVADRTKVVESARERESINYRQRRAQAAQIERDFQRESEELNELYDNPALNANRNAVDYFTLSEDLFLSVRGFRSAYQSRLFRNQYQYQIRDDLNRASAQAGAIAAQHEADRALQRQGLNALEAENVRLQRERDRAERHAQAAARILWGMYTRQDSHAALLAALDEALESNYEPQLHVHVVESWEGNESQELRLPTLRSELWRLRWRVTRRGKGGGFRVNVVSVLTKEIVATVTHKGEIYRHVLVSDKPGAYYLDVNTRGDVAYFIEVAELQ